MALLKIAEKQVFNISGSSKTKKTFSLTIAVLFAFNSISWTAPAQQNTLRAISTGQKDRAEKTKPLHKQTLSTLDAALNAILPEKPSVPLDSLALQSQLAKEIQQALAEPAVTIEISKTPHKSHYDRVLSILLKLKPGQGLKGDYVTYRLTKGGRVIIHLKTSGADYVRVYSLNNKGLLIKTDRYGKPVTALAVLTGLEEAVRDFLRSRARFDQKSSSAGELVQVEELTFKVSSEKLERMKEANPELAEDISNLINAICGPQPPSERLAEIEKSISETGPNPALIRLRQLLPSLIKIAVFGDVYLALVKDKINKEKTPLLIRKQNGNYKAAAILDMLPTDVMRIINKLSREGLKKVKKFVDGQPTRPIQPIPTRFIPWSSFYFQLKNSLILPTRIGVASLSNKFSYNLPIPSRFKIGDIPATTNDLKSFPRQGECYKPINFNELNLIEDYWLSLEGMFTLEATEELKQLQRKLGGYKFQEEIRNLNIDLMRWISRKWPKYKFITPSITLCNIFFKRKDGSDYYTWAEVVLAVSRENRLVPVLIGLEEYTAPDGIKKGYTLPGSIREEPNMVTGPTLMAHLSEEAISGILSTLPKESVEYTVWKAYAEQQGVKVSSKSSSAGMGINEFAELKPVALYATGFSAVLIEQFGTLHEQIMRKNNALAEVIRDKYTIGPIKGLKNPISLIGPFSYTDGTQIALMAIEYSDHPPRLLAIGNDPRLSLYKVIIKNMPILEAVIYQFIDSGSLPPEAISAWENCLEANARDIPEVRIETEQNPLPVFEGSRDYLAMMKEIQPELHQELFYLASYIRDNSTSGVKGFKRYVMENLKGLGWETLKHKGVITGVIPQDFIFSIKAKDTDQTFIISCWSAISPPSRIRKRPPSLEVSDIERICVVKSAIKSASAGFADCVELKDLDLKNLYFELTKELQSLQGGIRESFQEFLPFELSELIQQEDMAMAIDKKNLQRILLAIGPFRYGEKKLFLLLVKGKTFHRIIAIDPQDLKYLWIDITDKGGFVRIIENFIEELKRKGEDDAAAAEQLATLGRWIAVWNSAAGIQTIKPLSAAAILDRSSKGLREISQSA